LIIDGCLTFANRQTDEISIILQQAHRVDIYSPALGDLDVA